MWLGPAMAAAVNWRAVLPLRTLALGGGALLLSVLRPGRLMTAPGRLGARSLSTWVRRSASDMGRSALSGVEV